MHKTNIFICVPKEKISKQTKSHKNHMFNKIRGTSKGFHICNPLKAPDVQAWCF